MDEDTGRAIQVVAGVLSVSAISIAALATQPTNAGQAYAIVGAAFALIAALLGVHYGVKVATNGHGK